MEIALAAIAAVFVIQAVARRSVVVPEDDLPISAIPDAISWVRALGQKRNLTSGHAPILRLAASLPRRQHAPWTTLSVRGDQTSFVHMRPRHWDPRDLDGLEGKDLTSDGSFRSLQDVIEDICAHGYGARVPVVDHVDWIPIIPAHVSGDCEGVVAFDLDGTSHCPRRRDLSDAKRGMQLARQEGFAVVIITARPLPTHLPQDFESSVSVVYYNSKGKDIAKTKTLQLRHAGKILAPRSKRLALLDDDEGNVAAVTGSGYLGVSVRCGQLTHDKMREVMDLLSAM